MKYSSHVFWSDADAGYIAISPEFPRLSAFGDSPAQAVEELQIVLALAVETFEAEGWELPKPISAVEFSGQFRARIPKSLHAQLAMQAELDGVSLNTLVVSYIAAALGQQVRGGDDKRRREAA